MGRTHDAGELGHALRLEVEGHALRLNPSGVVALDTFRSTVFDQRYSEIAGLLPEDLVGELNAYYGDLSHAWQLFVNQRASPSMLQAYLRTAPERRAALLEKINAFVGRARFRRFLHSGT